MIGIGNIHASRGQWKDAVDKYHEALAVDVPFLTCNTRVVVY